METHHCFSPIPFPCNRLSSATRLIISITNIVTTLVSILEPLIRRIASWRSSIVPANRNPGEEALFLPIEIMVEIFSLLDAQTLLKLKSVCKQWRALIEDPTFVHQHASRALRLCHYHDQEDSETFSYIDSYHGLILERKGGNGSKTKYCVKNPTIRQVLDLPDPHENTMGMCICYASSSRCYKLVSVQEGENELEIAGVEVLTLGCSVDETSWRFLDATRLLNLNKPGAANLVLMRFEGVLHFTRKTHLGSRDIEVVSLDLDKECFTCTFLPRTVLPDGQTFWTTYGTQYPSLAWIAEDGVHLLLLEDYKKGKWAEMKIPIPLTVLIENSYMKTANIIWASKHSLWFLANECWDGEFKIYCILSQKVLTEKPPPPGKVVLYYKDTLVTFKGMRSERRKLIPLIVKAAKLLF